MDVLIALIGPDDGSANVPQLCVRAVLLVFFGIACIRVAGRKTFAQASPMDIIVAIVVGSNISRAMTGRAPFIGVLAASLVLVLLHRFLAMSTLKWNPFAAWMKPRPCELVRDGEIDEAALVRHGISRDDLMEGLRMEQRGSLDEVELAVLEGGGKISVIPKRRR